MFAVYNPPEPEAEPAAVIAFPAVLALVGVEYDFVSADSALKDIMTTLAANPCPGSRRALGDLSEIRARLLRVLESLDGPITEAVRMLEAAGPPPF